MTLRRRVRRPSPAMVVALIALFVSLGGTSYAALKLPRNSVGPLQLKNGAVTRPKIARNAVDSTKVRANSLTGRNINEGSLAAVPNALSAERANEADEAPISGVHYQTSSGNVTSATTPTTVSATCLPGLTVIGGGAQVSSDANAFVNDTNPVGRNGWEASAFLAQTGLTATLTVTAICAPVKATTP